jgi:hypothetical protein
MVQRRQPLLFGRNLVVGWTALAVEIAGFLLAVLGHGHLILAGAFIILVAALVELWIGVQMAQEVRRRRRR